MSSKPSSHRSLKEFYNVRAITIDPSILASTLAAENDRTAVIIAGSILEDQLRDALRHRLSAVTDEELEELRIFNPDGLIGTFSAKIAMARAMGVIEGKTADDLNDIREMRNACAHSFKHIDFATRELVAVSKRLFDPKRSFLVLEDESRNNIRQNFIAHCMAITVAISHGSREEAAKFMAATIAEMQAGNEPSPSTDKSQ